jgi:hypothetical protein
MRRQCLATIVLACSLLAARSALACPASGSNPGAPTSIVLQFGSFEMDDVDVGLVDESGAPAGLDIDFAGYPGAALKADRDQICTRVAEEFAPFDVNVTWSVPASALDLVRRGDAFMIVIGLSQVQMGSMMRGAERGGAADLDLRIGFVTFDMGGSPRAPKAMAQSASHELGHLVSWSWSPDFYFYHRGASTRQPSASAIMGTPFDDRPELWDDGGYIGGTYGEEIGLLGPALGERPDDHADLPESGTPLLRTNSGVWTRRLEGSGIVGMNADSRPTCRAYGDPGCPWRNYSWDQIDHVIFQARSGGAFTAVIDTLDQISGYSYSANLLADVELWRRTGKPGAAWERVALPIRAEPTGESAIVLHADGTASLTFHPRHTEYRSYALGIKSRGGYARIGQFHVIVSGTNVLEL